MSNRYLTPKAVEKLFTRKDGSYKFARWARPIAPVVFGVEDETLACLKHAITETVAVTGGTLAETDPEVGANFMWFFCTRWEELNEVPDLDHVVPDLQNLVADLNRKNLNQHRMFIFDAQGAIKMSLLFIRMRGDIVNIPAQVLAVGETLQSLLTWAEDAFSSLSPIAMVEKNGICIVKPSFAALVRAAYDPMLPDVAKDASHALRLQPRAEKLFLGLQQ
ncbi:MAG: hypothetical protein QM492_09880 [Rhodobacterales bacterium]